MGVALAHGFTLAVFAYAYGHISGTHVNPAVTFALALNGTVKWGQAAFYWIAQFAGAIFAAFVLKLAVESLGGDISAGATVGAFDSAQPIYAMVIEALLTFFLVNTILHTAVAGKGGAMAGWAIGATLTFAILAGGPFTGASLNPHVHSAPRFFPSQVLLDVYTYVIYFFGPLIGATLAVIVFNFNETAEEDDEEVVEVVEMVEEVVVEKKAPAKVRKPAVRKTVKK